MTPHAFSITGLAPRLQSTALPSCPLVRCGETLEWIPRDVPSKRFPTIKYPVNSPLINSQVLSVRRPLPRRRVE